MKKFTELTTALLYTIIMVFLSLNLSLLIETQPELILSYISLGFSVLAIILGVLVIVYFNKWFNE
jgi:hypothetical protein